MSKRKILSGIATIVVAACLSLFAVGPQTAGAQTTPTLQQQALQALQTIGVPCNAYSSGVVECSGYNTDNVYIDLRVHTDAADPDPTNEYVFDPYTGHSVRLWILEDDQGNVRLYGTDSETGMIDFTSGWLSVFYPTGNPFSAAVQNPMAALLQCNCFGPGGQDDGGWGDGGGGRQPIQPILS